MKYNLLPDSLHDRFDTWEEDWSEMASDKFLAEAQKCELMDAKQRETSKSSQDKKRKSSGDDDRPSASKRKKEPSKPYKKEKTFCNYCKLAGAPDWVCESHSTVNCKKKDQYQKALQSSASQDPAVAVRVATAASASITLRKKMRRELKVLTKMNKSLKAKLKSKGKIDDYDVSSVSSGDTNVSY